MYIQFLGDIFLRMLKMLIIPLLTCSIISAIGNLDLSLSRKIGLQSILYYVATTTFAVIQGIFWVLIIRPGSFRGGDNTVELIPSESRNITTTDTLLDLARSEYFEFCKNENRYSILDDYDIFIFSLILIDF